MAKYILDPSYSDMSVVVLGSSLSVIKKKLRKHWEDQLNNPEEYYEDSIKNIHYILDKEYSSVDELADDYNELMDEDYSFEEAY